MILHDEVKIQVLQSCKKLGFKAETEYRGKDWRADVFVLANGIKYAIEVQTSKQSLNKTLERQEKYKRDGVIGCWLFEKGPARMDGEREDLPLFLIKNVEDKTTVSIKDRKDLPIEIFINDFLQNKIKFCQTIRFSEAEIRFVKVKCWKKECGFDYYIYYIGNLTSSCNSKIFHNEEMWASNKLVMQPDIAARISEYEKSVEEQNFKIGKMKERFSKTVQDSYLSFGCPRCDAIFGDWFLYETIIDTLYGDGVDYRMLIKGNFISKFGHDIPHWCHPGEHDFCER